MGDVRKAVRDVATYDLDLALTRGLVEHVNEVDGGVCPLDVLMKVLGHVPSTSEIHTPCYTTIQYRRRP